MPSKKRGKTPQLKVVNDDHKFFHQVLAKQNIQNRLNFWKLPFSNTSWRNIEAISV